MAVTNQYRHHNGKRKQTAETSGGFTVQALIATRVHIVGRTAPDKGQIHQQQQRHNGVDQLAGTAR